MATRDRVSGMNDRAAETDRRGAMRRGLQTRVALRTEKAIFFMESVDVSTTGIRLQSEVPVELGSHCRLVPFFDDVSRLFEASGTVVRVSETPVAERTDVGIRFDTLNPAEVEALLGILRLADPIAPSADPRSTPSHA